MPRFYFRSAGRFVFMGDMGGYRGPALKILQDAGVEIGDVLELDLGGELAKGTVVPRYQSNDDSHLVIKLKSGYNVGISVAKISSIKKISAGEKPAFSSAAPRPRADLPEVAILGTGGTIASRVDYRTGAVQPAISAEDLYSLMPELSEVARISPEIIFTVSSEDLEPEHWGEIAQKVAECVSRGVRGVVVTMGTDVMGYTSAALAFALSEVPIPVLIVGSQRSSDRPSSDAYLNLMGAVSLAVSAEFSGVYVVMHANTSDDLLAVHRGTRVRKNHTSARDAFESVGVDPVAYWTRRGIELTGKETLPGRGTRNFSARPRFDASAALLKFYPSMSVSHLEAITGAGLKGLVIEGTGLGHINGKNIVQLRSFIKGGGLVCMTSQCIWGRVDLNVYGNGRDLLEAGVLPLEDMLGETALAKMMWVLANAQSKDERSKMMRENLAGEITERSFPRKMH
jgi:glutamyl-tRNA(Gln) amidotransferase subunit D